MKRKAVILVTASTQSKGSEFGDLSLSLSEYYSEAIVAAGGVPLVLPCLADETAVVAAVRQCDGIMLTGGDDVQPKLYARRLAPALRRTVDPVHPKREIAELWVIREAFQQRKPLLAICRGQQLLNVALGGDLVVDISQQLPGALNHQRSDKKDQWVHDVRLEPDSLLAKISGTTRLGSNSSHHQACGRIAELLRVVGVTGDGVVEALELKPEHARLLPFMVAVQYHPERLFRRHPRHLALFLYFVRVCAKLIGKVNT
ncbi:MAG: gamma-glutamyl-gamma-aminobutyrate hydrolase family protein [Verrucomicrobiota bacterium]